MRSSVFLNCILGFEWAISHVNGFVKFGTTLGPDFKREEGSIVPVDGQWSSWAPSSTCSVTCGIGTLTETRVCSPPVGGGTPCEGNATRNSVCDTGMACLQGWLLIMALIYWKVMNGNNNWCDRPMPQLILVIPTTLGLNFNQYRNGHWYWYRCQGK